MVGSRKEATMAAETAVNPKSRAEGAEAGQSTPQAVLVG